MAEELTDYYAELGIRIRYLHSDVKTLERMEIIRELREGKFDVLVGINLLREGLDIPEVSLVAILDADKEGFLRSTRSLIQTIGRAARNVDGHVILYADQGDGFAARDARGDEPAAARSSSAYNEEHGITPKTVEEEASPACRDSIWEQDYVTVPTRDRGGRRSRDCRRHEVPALIERLRSEMREAARELEFERAAELRDRVKALEFERIRLT